MTANQSDTVSIYRFETAAHDLAQYRRIDAFFRKTVDGHRGDWCSSHRPDVVNGIEGGDASIVVRVVDDWSKEVERLHQSEVVAKAVYSRVVGCIEPDNQIGVGRLFG